MTKSSFLLGSILPNFALWDQGGAQARRAAPLSGPAARPSLGAGGPAISRWVAPKKIPGLGFGQGSPFRTAPLGTLADLEDVTSTCAHWYNTSRPVHRLGRRPPAEAEAEAEALSSLLTAGGSTPPTVTRRGGFCLQ